MTYDNNGNITQDGSRRFTYSSYDLVTNITQGGESTRFKYDANRQRFERYDVKVEAGVTTYLTTLYVGGMRKSPVAAATNRHSPSKNCMSVIW